MTAGEYNMTFSKPNHVDPTGVNVVTKPITVNPEASVAEIFRYDQPGSITARFNTKRGAAAAVPAYPGWGPPGTAFTSLSHSGLLQGTRSYVVNPPGTEATITNLFPFTDGYSVYAGGCPGANPASYTMAPTPPPFAVPNTQTVLPGGAHTVDVRVPALRFRYRAKASSPSSEYWVGMPGQNLSTSSPTTVAKLTATAPGCGGQMSYSLDSTLFANNTDAGGFIDRPVGRPVSEDWGIPIGTYDICVDTVVNFDPRGTQGSGRYRGVAINVPIKDPDGELVSFDLQSGSCP
jgi:hypothetical protein